MKQAIRRIHDVDMVKVGAALKRAAARAAGGRADQYPARNLQGWTRDPDEGGARESQISTR